MRKQNCERYVSIVGRILPASSLPRSLEAQPRIPRILYFVIYDCSCSGEGKPLHQHTLMPCQCAVWRQATKKDASGEPRAASWHLRRGACWDRLGSFRGVSTSFLGAFVMPLGASWEPPASLQEPPGSLQKPPGSYFGSNARNDQNEYAKVFWKPFWDQGPEILERSFQSCRYMPMA